jgi:hypothetical protein
MRTNKVYFDLDLDGSDDEDDCLCDINCRIALTCDGWNQNLKQHISNDQ